MELAIQAGPVVRWRIWAARALQALLVAFLALDAGMKVLRTAPAVEATVQLGFSASAVAPIGLVLLAFTALYVMPGTAALGAVLLTGYLGGAVAIQVRAGSPTFSIAFPLLFATLLWVVLLLRDQRVGGLLPFRR
jgi:hypothetical protein